MTKKPLFILGLICLDIKTWQVSKCNHHFQLHQGLAPAISTFILRPLGTNTQYIFDRRLLRLFASHFQLAIRETVRGKAPCFTAKYHQEFYGYRHLDSLWSSRVIGHIILIQAKQRLSDVRHFLLNYYPTKYSFPFEPDK